MRSRSLYIRVARARIHGEETETDLSQTGRKKSVAMKKKKKEKRGGWDRQGGSRSRRADGRRWRIAARKSGSPRGILAVSGNGIRDNRGFPVDRVRKSRCTYNGLDSSTRNSHRTVVVGVSALSAWIAGRTFLHAKCKLPTQKISWDLIGIQFNFPEKHYDLYLGNIRRIKLEVQYLEHAILSGQLK